MLNFLGNEKNTVRIKSGIAEKFVTKFSTFWQIHMTDWEVSEGWSFSQIEFLTFDFISLFDWHIKFRTTKLMHIPTSIFCTWPQIPEKMVFYDYISNNLAKGRLFRAVSMDNGDGIAVGWLAAAKSSLRLRWRMYDFFTNS